MIRSAKLSLKFLNKNKRAKLLEFLAEYRRAVDWFIDELWDTNAYKFVGKEIYVKFDSWLAVRTRQCAGQQALAIIDSTLKKHKQRVWKYKQLKKAGEDAQRLEKYVNNPPSKPKMSNVEIMLGTNCVKIEHGKNSFDLWITLGGLKSKSYGYKIVIPVKKTKSFNKWNKIGTLKQCALISDEMITVMFNVDVPDNNKIGTIGIDVGMNNVLSCSDDQQIVKDHHGYTLSSICQKLSRCKKGSKGFLRAQQHRKNFINWSVNQLNLQDIREIRIEDIKGMRKGKRTSRLLSHFTYVDIFGKLEQLC